jgi:signal transduction histidine kinase
VSARMHRVRRESIRVALVATAIVAAVYVAIAAVVLVISERNLTGDIDSRLTTAMTRARTQPFRTFSGSFPELPGGTRFGAPVLSWLQLGDGAIVSPVTTTAALPVEPHSIGGPTTLSIGGTDVRVAGGTVPQGYLVVGQSLDSVAQARSNVVRAELVVGPVLLLAVFLGAMAIGRRVASPIERSRLQQMEFTADASHELRTPLSVIEAQTALALTGTRDATWNRRAFERIDHESKRIRHLVEDLLWLARFDATGAQPNGEHVDLGVLATQAADRFAGVAETRRLTLAVSTERGALVVNAPPEWLDRLLGVLLDNACKYAPDQGGVDVAVRAEGGRIKLSVDDTGPGIPAEERARIFDRFHRATDSPGGAGLGLAIADAVVRATGGRWEVGESPAGGASMSVSWPRALSGPREPAPVPSVSPSA